MRSLIVYLVMFGWVPFALSLFVFLPARRALIAGYLLGWLFLPVARFNLPGLPDLNKITAVNLGMFLGACFFDRDGRVLSFRPRWYDAPMIVWCLVPFCSSLLNGLGAYDGVSGILTEIFYWGMPYVLGRVYFGDWDGVRELAIGLFIGGLLYVPFCLWEIRMSPQLHYQIYGFRASKFHMTVRLGGYRPLVFMTHGIELGMWMTAACVSGIWLWFSGALKRLWGMRAAWLVAGLVVVTFICRSTGALALLLGGLGILFCVRYLGLKLCLLALALIPPAYVITRTSGAFTGESLIEFGRDIGLEERRLMSLGGRLYHETRLADKALDRPFFGWGGFGRNRIYNEEGEDTSVTDGMWIVTFGIKGLIALAASGIFLLLPIVQCWRRYDARTLLRPEVAPAFGLAMVLALFAVDCLLNFFLVPYYVVCAGALIALPVWSPAPVRPDAVLGRKEASRTPRAATLSKSRELVLHREPEEKSAPQRRRPVY